jgi:solute carrier family 9 (sodium/hydrogen exchanger), member 8
VFQTLKVDPTLFYLVFGESALNDAIAITIFKVCGKYIGISMTTKDICIFAANFVIVFLCSCVLGYLLGIAVAMLFKSHRHLTNHVLLSVSILILAIYIPFLLAEMIQLSGIVTILFSGIACRRYVNKNLNASVKRMASFVLQLLSSFADTGSVHPSISFAATARAYAQFTACNVIYIHIL